MVKVQANLERLRQLLAEKNIAQNRLAKLSGVTSGYMSQIMTGKRNPSARLRKKMLSAINATQRAKGLKEYDFNELFTITG